MSDATDLRLLDDYQRDLPLVPEPFAEMARDLGLTQDQVIRRLESLETRGDISRVGAVVAPNTVGASTLAAMAVPPERLTAVARVVSARPEVNHNYEREHRLNLWFVVVARDRAAVRRVLGDLERETGMDVIDLPLVEAYHIDLGFPLS